MTTLLCTNTGSGLLKRTIFKPRQFKFLLYHRPQSHLQFFQLIRWLTPSKVLPWFDITELLFALCCRVKDPITGQQTDWNFKSVKLFWHTVLHFYASKPNVLNLRLMFLKTKWLEIISECFNLLYSRVQCCDSLRIWYSVLPTEGGFSIPQQQHTWKYSDESRVFLQLFDAAE